MKGLANPDSRIYALLNKLVLLMELNVLVVLCCLPVVTAGAALASMHGVLLKIYRGEENRIAGDFFHAMKGNLKKSTVLWLLFLGYLGLLAGVGIGAVRMIPENAVYVLFGVLLAAMVGLIYLDWALILQSRYVYTVPQCLKYALLAWFQYPGSTVVYPVSLVIPLLLCCSVQTMIIAALLGVTLPHMVSTTLYSRVFDRMEDIPDRLPKL